jgi:pyruvate/2-oxoglutarate dehydrogenase complex dihydrolipoamide dehydrogenase (E3) component
LRTFDKDIVEKVRAYMELAGTRILTGVTPKSIQKLPSGKLLVTYSTGVSEEFDTVLAAVGE